MYFFGIVSEAMVTYQDNYRLSAGMLQYKIEQVNKNSIRIRKILKVMVLQPLCSLHNI